MNRAGGQKTCFLCGIGGSGMSALAQLLAAQGWRVCGSDRSRDRGETPEKFRVLEQQGFILYPQDGSGVRAGIIPDLVIVSSAIEDTIPDVGAAKEKGIPIKKRAEVLAELFNAAPLSIAVGGTSGKSTVTAMTGWILEKAGLNPTVVNGAVMINFQHAGGIGNIAVGRPDIFVAEVDESDGSIELFNPSVAVLTNVSLDHKPMAELRRMFGAFVGRAGKAAILNLDDRESAGLKTSGAAAVTFGLNHADAALTAIDIMPEEDGVAFTLSGRDQKEIPVRLPVPGRHNVANALAALAATFAAGVSLERGAAALGSFTGNRRRFEIVGAMRGVTVIDDFAHNPDKIAATLRTLHEKAGRVWAVFQPHGYGPTKLMRHDLVETLARELGEEDVLLMPEIYFAGGTATKDISSRDIVDEVVARGQQARFFSSRDDIINFLAQTVQSGDRIIVMGARDDTLPEFCRAILNAIQ